MQVEINKELLEEIKIAIEDENTRFIQNRLGELHAADITSLLYGVNTQEAKYVLDLLELKIRAEIISLIDEEVQPKFLKFFTSKEIADLIQFIDSDDAADILLDQENTKRDEIIAQVKDEEKIKNILDLLRYDENVAGGLMAKELITCNINWTVIQCIEEIRRQAEKVEKIFTLYVVNNANRLLGTISTKKLLLAKDETQISAFFDQNVISVDANTPQEEVSSIMSKYDLEAIPVVNVKKRLLGRITIDDVVDVIQEQADLDKQLMSGISESVEFNDSVLQLTRARLPWLIIGMAGGLLGAKLMGFFEDDLRAIPAMAFFIPLITATGGNVGIQSSSIIVQKLAQHDRFDKNMWQQFFKSLLVAIINGVAISTIVLIFGVFIQNEIHLPVVVSIALFSVVLLSSFMGTITPLILTKFNINPALASGPFITTTNDILGIVVYFSVAHIII